MAIYVNNLGDSQSLPLSINDPQEGQSLVWSEEQGAYINATVDATAATEVIQDTVAQMVETDPDGTSLSLRLVTSYDDATGKLLFNVVGDTGTGGGTTGTTLLTVQEDGVTRGAFGALNFVGSSVTMEGATAIITGGLSAVEILTNGVTQGDVQKFNFDRLNVSVNGDTVTVQGPDLSAIVADLATKASTQYVDDAIASLDIDLTDYATKAYVDSGIANLVSSSPATLDTLNEIATALGNDPNFATTITTLIGTKVDNAQLQTVVANLTTSEELSALETTLRELIDIEHQHHIGGDNDIIASAVAYTDSAVSGLASSLDLDALESNTISYIDNAIATEHTHHIEGDAQTLLDAKAYVDVAISNLVDGAPTALDTLKELSDALQASDSLAQNIANQLATMPTLTYLASNYATQQSVNQQVTDAVIQTTAYIDSELTNFVKSAVQVDGTSIVMDENGVISAIQTPYTLPTASTTTLGGVKVDGSTITADLDGVISANSITLQDVATYLADQGYAPLSSTSITLEDLSDTYVTGVSDGQALIWSSENNRWQPGTAIGGTGGGISITDVGTYLSTNGYATETYVQGQINNLVNGAQATLDTLNELAAALNNDADFAATITTDLAGKLAISGGTMTGSLILAGNPTQDLEAATKQYVDARITSSVNAALSTVGSSNVEILDDLTDVDTIGVQDTFVLTYDAATSKWVAAAGVAGPTGATGAQGDAGVSVTSATVTTAGRLLVTLSDNTVVDAGNVSGIKAATVNVDGELVLTKQDNTTINAGSVIGPQGDQGIQGPQGPQGPTGATGVGFSTATVDGSGRLIITKTDATTVDAGSVVGPQGPTGATGATGPIGATGPAGLGVFQAVVDGSGNLQLTMTDASVINAGYVRGDTGAQGPQGPAGRSVSAVAVDESGYLQVTLTDSTVVNAGYVVGPQGSTGATGATGPQGPAGPQGEVGPQGESYTVNGTSGSVQIYGLSGTTRTGYDFEVDYSNEAGQLATARTIALAGKVTGLTSFDGSGNVTITTALSGVTTNDITEGVSNQYFTTARARAALSVSADSSIGSLLAYDSNTGVVKYRASTSYITEGSNLYFTNTRADARADYRISQSSIDTLADVDTTAIAPVNGDVLTWTGSAWTPAAPTGGGTGSVLSVNSKTGAVTLITDDIAEGVNNLYYTNARFDARFSSKDTDDLPQGTTNKYFSDALARNALNAGTGLLYNSATGTFTLNANTDQVAEGSANLYFTNARFDTRLGQSTLDQFADVADTTPTTGQALAWNGSSWAPTTITATSSGGGTSSGIFRAEVQVEYAANGDLSSVNVISGGISANIVTATSTTATVEFTFTNSVCAPLSAQVYGYQRVNNVYVTRAIGSDFTSRTLAGGGVSGSPTAFNSFNPSDNKMTISLTKSLTGATAGLGQTTHCVISFLLSSV